MKVKELIELLQRQDPDSQVSIGYGDELLGVAQVGEWNGERRHFILEADWILGDTKESE